MSSPRPFVFKLGDWFRSRQYRHLGWGMPALLAGITWLVLAGVCRMVWVRSNPQRHYAEIVSRALAGHDFETARVASLRLFQASEGVKEYQFDLALALEGLGRQAEADALLAEAAPLDKPGYPLAHLHLARRLMAQSNAPPQAARLAEIHLRNAGAGDSKSPEIVLQLGRLAFQRRDWATARSCFMELVPVHPELALSIAMLSKNLQDETGMRTWANMAASYYREKVASTRVAAPADRLGLAQALMLLDDCAAAFSTLEIGWKQTGNKVYAAALGDCAAAWLQATSTKHETNLALRAQLLQQGLEYAPQNTQLLRQLVALSRLEGPEAAAARAIVTKRLAEGHTSAVLHFVLGNDAWQHGQMEEAGNHFTLAFEAAPNMPAVANNMAAFLATGDKPDLPRALGIIEPLVKKYPEEPIIRETRGQILVKLGRWRDAISDLEIVLPLLEAKGPTHAALAAAYRGLGMTDLASEHQRLANPPAPVKDPPSPSP